MRKRLAFLFLILILVSLQAVPIQKRVAGESGSIGVRISAQAYQKYAPIKTMSEDIIDYGSFVWMAASQEVLSELDRAGVSYQLQENPYLLTLGGQTFDPLFTSPSVTIHQQVATGADEPGFHLVQFQGPTKSEWLESLNNQGLHVLQYIHPFTYVVWGQRSTLTETRERAFVRWAGDYLPDYALQPQNRTLASTPVALRSLIYPGAGLEGTLQAFEMLGASQITATTGIDPVFDLVTLVLPGDQLLAAASLPGVYALQPIPTDGGDRGEMSSQVNVGNYDGTNRAFTGYLNWLSEVGLSGQGVIIANVDSGIDQSHPALIQRILPCVGPTCGGLEATNHGTHTAGIMAGDGTLGITDRRGFLRGLGMAPGAKLVEQVYSPTYTQPGGMLTLMTESSRNGAVISGNSWGPSATPLGYDMDTRLVDTGVRDADPAEPGNQPLSYVLSIMNGNGGTSTQGTPDEAKNTFTVGSTEMQFTNGTQKLNINDLSANTAHGPALDGRLIPHLVAPGCSVDSTTLGSSYGLICGTSMASPQVSGSAALFYEKYRHQFGVDPSPALVKAAFLPVAYNLAGHLDADGNLLGHPFDAKQGWGRLNAGAVLQPTGEVTYYDQQVLLTETGQTWSVDVTANLPVRSLRAMLVWTDAPGHGLGGSTPAWNNDLDLSFNDGSLTYYGNQFGADGLSIAGGTADFMNNTEGIFLSDLAPGTYTLTVTAANLASDGVPGNGFNTDQDFALVTYIAYDTLIYETIFTIFFR